MKHLLETDNNFTYETTEKYGGIEFEVYFDGYGQSYTITWIDPQTKEVKEWSCGTFNDYHYDIEDIADSINERRENMRYEDKEEFEITEYKLSNDICKISFVAVLYFALVIVTQIVFFILGGAGVLKELWLIFLPLLISACLSIITAFVIVLSIFINSLE